MKKIFPHELVGKEIEVVSSKNKQNLGLKGKVIDETKHTLKISHQGVNKTLLKGNVTFKIKSLNLTIEGKTIIKRPEERIKGK